MKSFFNSSARSNHCATPPGSASVNRWFAALLTVSCVSCGAMVDPPDPANSQTHWLETCVSNAECGDLECLCGVCTTRCTSESQCAELNTEAVCATGGERCAGLTNNPICVKACTNDDDCPEDGTCDDGSCSVAITPTGAQPAGAACDVAEDCASGYCIGKGCGPFQGVCDGPEFKCTKGGPSTYCSCDGETFEGSGSCAFRRYSHEGACDAPSDAGADAGAPVSPVVLSLGELCTEDNQCESGACRSETCFAADARCVNLQSACLDNIAQFCGCDGVTLQGSSGGYGCAPAPYAFQGACGNGTQPAGERCDVNEDCESGVCEGQGCGPFEGVCAAVETRDCEDDLVTYCGCDGVTFMGSSGCPERRFSSRGECDAYVSEEKCAQQPENTCAIACVPVYGVEPDGSSHFLACSVSGHNTKETDLCAQSPDGETLSVPQGYVPDGWTTTTGPACNPECHSPFDDMPWLNPNNLPGCECTSTGSACFEGIGLECVDPTDDLDPTRHWSVATAACDTNMDDCEGGYMLQPCLDRFERCIQSGVVLDKGDLVYCGASPIPCGERDEAGCDGECTPQWGKTSAGSLAYAGCLGQEDLCTDDDTPEPYCLQRLTPQTRVGLGPIVHTHLCTVPSGWSQLPLEYCEGASTETTCFGLSEEQCAAPCGVRRGRHPNEVAGEFFGCADSECVNSATVCAANASGDIVELFGCVLPGWSEIDASYCQSE